MKTNQLLLWAGPLILAAVFFCLTGMPEPVAAQAAPVKNIVIVHGALSDGSGWRGVFELLTKKGYNVTVVQNPCTSLKDDVDAANFAIDKMDGPVVLVGHSWGGTVWVIPSADCSPGS